MDTNILTWIIFVVLINRFKECDMKNTCNSWRLEIHRKIEKTGEVLDLGLFVRNFAASVSSAMEPYTNLQLQLENIAEKVNLYERTAEDTNKTMQQLLHQPEVIKIIKECKKAHAVYNCSRQSLYRRADGICNNLKHPLWGSGSYKNDRILPPAYVGIRGLRKSVTGEDLPDYRSISLKLKNTSNPSQLVSAFFTFYGQTIVHDITLIPGITYNGSAVDCCAPDQNIPSVCVSIYNRGDDPFYGPYNYTCVPIIRTAPYPTCTFNRRMQMNKITSFLDLSLVYGSSFKKEKEMRGENNLGRLKSQNSEFGEILPKAENDDALFCPMNESEWCFLSGDERVNQHVQLMSLHTMFVRLHNQIHDSFMSLNPHWDKEKLYQETRRLVTALQQYMVYNEYLPLLVGPHNMKKYNLALDEGSVYDDELSPNMLIEFNTASFRLHSMVPRETSKFQPQIPFDLSYSFTCPIHGGQMDSYIGGSCEIPSERNDRYVKDDVKDYLYRPPRATYGDDVAAINIARGRDHGLPIYIDAVSKCFEREIKKFSDLQSLMTSENVRLLKSIYKDVRDIDLWVGLILEREVEGGVTGPTAACISAIHFHRMKYGDSFFFTHINGRYPLTKAQLQAIRKYSISRFICDTTNQTKVRKQPLVLPGIQNPLIHCKYYSRLDLSAWKEKQ